MEFWGDYTDGYPSIEEEDEPDSSVLVGTLRERLISSLRDLRREHHWDDLPNLNLLVDAVLPIIEARDKARAEEFKRLAAAELAQAKQMARVGPAKQLETEIANDAWERGAAFGFRRAAQMLEEKLS